MRKSKAKAVGECWLCGRGWLWHFAFGWFLDHDYDPITTITYEEFQRLDDKHRGYFKDDL